MRKSIIITETKIKEESMMKDMQLQEEYYEKEDRVYFIDRSDGTVNDYDGRMRKHICSSTFIFST